MAKLDMYRNRPPLSGGRCKRSLAGVLTGVFALIVAIGFAPHARAQDTSDEDSLLLAKSTAAQGHRHPREKTFMKREWGVEVLFVRETAGGYMLEFRYKVLDPEKAKALFERQTKPVLTHARTGARMIVPTPAKTGALRNSNLPLVGHTYWMFFANPGKFVKPGEQVSIEIGDFRAERLIVR